MTFYPLQPLVIKLGLELRNLKLTCFLIYFFSKPCYIFSLKFKLLNHCTCITDTVQNFFFFLNLSAGKLAKPTKHFINTILMALYDPYKASVIRFVIDYQCIMGFSTFKTKSSKQNANENICYSILL